MRARYFLGSIFFLAACSGGADTTDQPDVDVVAIAGSGGSAHAGATNGKAGASSETGGSAGSGQPGGAGSAGKGASGAQSGASSGGAGGSAGSAGSAGKVASGGTSGSSTAGAAGSSGGSGPAGAAGAPGPSCGNMQCEAGEDCTSCPGDCGACPAMCGNGQCEAGEDCNGCPGDCGACPSMCPVLAFPSGIHIETFEDAAMSANYDAISDTGCFPKPTCWIDVDNLHDPVASMTYDTSVHVSDHFQLSELVGTELSYSHKVLLSPDLVAHLETFRANAGGNPMTITSGYRSPQHQKAVCQSVCGQDCCPNDPTNPCACRSRHEWGDAADVASTTPSSLYTAAGQSGFGYCLAETGHLHVDMSPCGAGCPP